MKHKPKSDSAVRAAAVRQRVEHGIEYGEIEDWIEQNWVGQTGLKQDHISAGSIRHWVKNERDRCDMPKSKSPTFYTAASISQLEEQVQSWMAYRELEGFSEIEVVDSVDPVHVARCGAEMVIRILKRLRKNGKTSATIGFFFGNTPTHAARELARLISQDDTTTSKNFPTKISLAALNGSLDNRAPSSHPYTAFHYFTESSEYGQAAKIKGIETTFHAPPELGLVRKSRGSQIRSLGLDRETVVAEADAAGLQLDVIIASIGHSPSDFGAANLEDHLAFTNHLELACNCKRLLPDWTDTKQVLGKHKVCGDIAYWPVNNDGPLSTKAVEELPLWVQTLLTVDEIADFVGVTGNCEKELPFGRGQVVLLCAPCSGESCPDRRKGLLLRNILKYPRTLFNYLSIDKFSAQQLLTSDDVEY